MNLRERLVDEGARFENFDGVEHVTDFGDDIAEARAVREGVGLTVRPRGVLVMTGPDRAKYLHGQVTNAITNLEVGQGCYACHLTGKGKMIADLVVRCEDDRLVLTTEPTATATVLESVGRYVMLDDCEIERVEATPSVILLAGPRATEVLARVIREKSGTNMTAALSELSRYHFLAMTVEGHAITIVGDRTTGDVGYEIHGATIDAVHWAMNLLLAVDDVTPFGSRALDILRVEAGVPVFGRDMNEETIPPEAGLEHAISYTKGCYLGQEVVARLKTYGNPPRRLVGLRSADKLMETMPLEDENGTAAGAVGTAVISVRLQRPAALAMVRRAFSEPGTLLRANFGGRSIEAEVVALPFEDAAS